MKSLLMLIFGLSAAASCLIGIFLHYALTGILIADVLAFAGAVIAIGWRGVK